MKEYEFSLDEIRDFYKLQYIKRYNTWQRINNESVAEHSFYVTLFANRICVKLNIIDKIKHKAVELAMIHDLPEIVINDITYDAKCVMPEIKNILNKYEEEYLSSHFYDIINMPNFDNEEKKFLHYIVKMADTMSSIQYCDNEIELGNRRFIKILEEASTRYNYYHSKVIEMIRGGNYTNV